MAFAIRNNTPAIIDSQDPENLKIVGANPTGIALLRFLGPDAAVKDDVIMEKIFHFKVQTNFQRARLKARKI